jgi:hypothetical protein
MKTNKVYLVYMSNYEEVVRDGAEATEILGIYNNKEEAYNVARSQINRVLEDHNWILDMERNDLDRDGYVRFFFNNQENWDCYFELTVAELEVK